MMKAFFSLMFTAAVILPGASLAATGNNWPCVQRKVPEISLVSVWTSNPPGQEATAMKGDDGIETLASDLAARRLELPEAQKKITDYATTLGAQKQAKLEALFLALFDKLNAERGDVISGIERFGQKQLQLADKLRKAQEALSAKRADAKTDPGELQDMTDQFTWDTRIFDERRKSLSYVCEVPVIIEHRLFELSKTIQTQLK